MGPSMVGAVALALAGSAAAREVRLHPVASGVSVPGVITVTPWELDVSDPEFSLTFDLRNDTDRTIVMPMQGARCVRGDFVSVAHGRTRPLKLDPYEVKRLEVRCDHGRWVTGAFGLILPEVATAPDPETGAPGEVLATEITWVLQERDTARNRQRRGKPLACLTYRRPAEPAPAPADAVEDPAAPASTAPTATLRPR